LRPIPPKPRSFVVGDEVEDPEEQERHRLAEIDQFSDLRLSQDRPGITQVGEDDAGVGVPSEQGVRVHSHDRVVVYVDHPHVRGDLPGDLMHVAAGGDPGPDVDDLTHARLTDQEAHRPL
jgi:hypothetical protein